MLHALVMQRARQMMMVHHIVMLVRAEHDRNHVLAEKYGAPFGRFVLAPALALFLHLPHPDRHLGRAQRQDRDRLQDWVARIGHDLNLSLWPAKITWRPASLWFHKTLQEQMAVPRPPTFYVGSAAGVLKASRLFVGRQQ